MLVHIGHKCMVLHGTKVSAGSTFSIPTKIEGIVQFVLFLAHHNFHNSYYLPSGIHWYFSCNDPPWMADRT